MSLAIAAARNAGAMGTFRFRGHDYSLCADCIFAVKQMPYRELDNSMPCQAQMLSREIY